MRLVVAMDTGEYDTNSLLFNNISCISFRIYEPIPEHSTNFSSVALEIESFFRNDGHIVVYDVTRAGIWHFQVTNNNSKPEVASFDLGKHVEVLGCTLNLREEGSLEPSSLQKSRSQAQQSNNTPTSSSSNGSVLDQFQPRYAFPTTPQGIAPHSQEIENASTNAVTLDSPPLQTPQKSIYENFIVAILLTISTSFCRRDSSALPLNFRTILLSPNLRGAVGTYSAEQRPLLGTLRAYLTPTGALIIRFAVSHCQGLASAEEFISDTVTPSTYRIIAAPFGVLANNRLAHGEVGVTSTTQTPNTQALSLRGMADSDDSSWKQACKKIVQLRGVANSMLVDCTWADLLLSTPGLQDFKTDAKRSQGHGSTTTASISWPKPLCFRKKALEILSTCRVDDTLLSGHDENHDPLGCAKGWFALASDREEKISKRKAERTASEAKELNGVDHLVPKPSSHSPLALRRPSTAAAGAMYPTPPDAIQQLSGVTPSMDGTLSSPGNPLSAAAVPDLEPAPPNPVGDAFDDGADFVESKQNRRDSNLLGEAENMFGDMGGDMFDDNDITEADFNFFDERPEDMDLDLGMAEVRSSALMTPLISKTREDHQPSPSGVVPQLSSEQIPVVFAKPELKHARSSQNEDTTYRSRPVRPGSSKRESSPFDPQAVFKRVRASLASRGRVNIPIATLGKTRAFERIDFDPTIPMISKKYEKGGLFDYDTTSSFGLPKLDLGALPKTEYLKRHGRQNRRSKKHAFSAGTLITGLEPSKPNISPVKPDGSISDDDDSSITSDQDDSSYTSEDPASSPKPSVKHAAVDDDAGSQTASVKDNEPMEEFDQPLAIELPRLSKPTSPDLCLSTLFSDPEPLAMDIGLSDVDFIQIAQLLTEQAATGDLRIRTSLDEESSIPDADQNRLILSASARHALNILGDIMPVALGHAVPLHFKELLDIQDAALILQPNRVQPRSIPGRDGNPEPLRPSNLYQIPCPHLEVKRSDLKLSVLPPAVSFWESLGFAPTSGSKDVNAVCVFPDWTGMADNAKTFLGRMKSVYEILKLGSFESMTVSPDLKDGIVPYEVDKISTLPDTTMAGYGSALFGSMDTLCGTVSNLPTSGTNIVVYFVYSPQHPGTIVEACAAFQRFFESHQRVLAQKRETVRNEIVLQLVAADVLSSSTSIVVTSASDLHTLCMQTYDRCTLFGGPMPAPAIKLEQPLPRIIDFKLTSSPSASLIRENSCIHVAYAESVDDRWITAAWTDDRGNQQATASYCLGRKGKPTSRSMNEVAHEMWESTLELISSWKVHWRIVITKCAPMDQDELEFWADLARTEIKASVTLILMTVDTNPSLQLIPPAVKLSPPSAPFYTTPVSTPQANIVSPEQTAAPATPARDSLTTAVTPGAENTGEADLDSFLADVTDQTWGAIVGHRLSNAKSVLELHPALVSGYLIKRTGTRAEDAPVLMEVNLIHTEASPRAYEPLLREMLSYFRGLGTLARARGVVDQEGDVRPWHIAAAEKAARALYLLM